MTGREGEKGCKGGFESFCPGLLLLAAAGMELCWLFAAAAFFTAALSSKPFPYGWSAVVFWLGAALTLLGLRGGWRIIYNLLLHLAGLTFALLTLLYLYYGYRGTAFFFTKRWLTEIFARSGGLQEAFILACAMVFFASFYISGAALIRRRLDYSTVNRRLDAGIGIFLLLFFINAGVKVPDLTALYLLFPFFFCGLAAAALARHRGDGQKEYLPGQRWLGLVLTFSAGVLFLAAGALLVLLPLLTAAAEGGLTLLKWALHPFFYSFLLPALQFFFGRRSGKNFSEPGDLPGGGDVALPEPSPESFRGELVAKIFSFGFLGLLGVVVLIAVGWGSYHLLRWLLRKGSPARREVNFSFSIPFALWFVAFKRWGHRLWGFLGRRIFNSATETSEVIRVYRHLLRWGRSCGLPHRHFETPREYARRLAACFPGAKTEIEVVVEFFNREVYGELPLMKEELPLLKQARRKLSSPLLWLSRFRPILIIYKTIKQSSS